MAINTNDMIIMLKARRVDRKLTWKELAAEIGISPQHMTEIMKGRRAIRGRVLEYLGVKRSEFYEQIKPNRRQHDNNAD
jgi:transcriptional regulator with XRE-family HTH domain